MKRTTKLGMVAVIFTACTSTQSGEGGAGATSDDAAASSTTVVTSSTVTAASATTSGLATSPAECEALTGAPGGACMNAGCVGGHGYRFPAGVAACEVQGLPCDGAEAIALCLYDEPGTAYLFKKQLGYRVVDGRTEVLELPGLPWGGAIPGFTIGCPQVPTCPEFEGYTD